MLVILIVGCDIKSEVINVVLIVIRLNSVIVLIKVKFRLIMKMFVVKIVVFDIVDLILVNSFDIWVFLFYFLL